MPDNTSANTNRPRPVLIDSQAEALESIAAQLARVADQLAAANEHLARIVAKHADRQ